MLMRTYPFPDLDSFTRHTFGGRPVPASMPMDAYRSGDTFTVRFDLPGVAPESIDLTVEKDVLTVTAERAWESSQDTQVVVTERPQGTFRRQLLLGKVLDADKATADYTDGILTVTIPVAEQSKPRKVTVTSGGAAATIDATAA